MVAIAAGKDAPNKYQAGENENMPRPRKMKYPTITAEDVYGGSTPMEEPGRGISGIMPGTSRGRSPKVDIKTARAVFDSLAETNPVAFKKDKCTKSKKLLKTPTVSWVKNTGSADVPSVDAPGRCTTKMINGEEVTVCTVPKNAKFDKMCKPKGKSRAKANPAMPFCDTVTLPNGQKVKLCAKTQAELDRAIANIKKQNR